MPNNYTIHYQIFVNCRKTPCTMLSIYHAKPFFRGSKFKSIEKPHFNGLTLPDLNDSQFHTDCTPNPALIKVVRVAPQRSYAVRPRHTTTCPTESNPTLPTVRLKLRYLAFFPHPRVMTKQETNSCTTLRAPPIGSCIISWKHRLLGAS